MESDEDLILCWNGRSTARIETNRKSNATDKVVGSDIGGQVKQKEIVKRTKGQRKVDRKSLIK